MTDELRAARERLRRDIESGEVTRDRVPDGSINDLLIVAMHDIAEHAADDDELADFEWLQTLPLKRDDMGSWTTITGLVLADMCQRPGDHVVVPRLRVGRMVVKWEPTRGDVRRLLAALGIELLK